MYGLKHQKEKRSMDHFAGLDVSVKETSVCIVDDTGRIVREVSGRRPPHQSRTHAVQQIASLCDHLVGPRSGPDSKVDKLLNLTHLIFDQPVG